MRKIKVLVNFELRKVIHISNQAVGSDGYNQLIMKGYEVVGDVKIHPGDDRGDVILAFWRPAFFNPKDKYYITTPIKATQSPKPMAKEKNYNNFEAPNY